MTSPIRAWWWPASTLLRHLYVAVLTGAVLYGLTYQLEPFRNYQLGSMAALLCATAGLTVLVGQNGQLSLGHGAIMAVGAYTVALMQIRFDNAGNDAGWTIVASLGTGVLAAIVAGTVIGLAAARLRGPYLAGVTLAVAVIVPAITTTYYSVFNGDQGLTFFVPPPPEALGPAIPPEQWQAWLALVGAALVMMLLANVGRSRFGRAFRAVRDDEVAARLCGIHVARTQVLAFVLSAATAGLGGGLLAIGSQSVSPGAFSLTLSLYLFLAIVIGGLGSLIGAIWGSIVLVLLPDLIQSVADRFTTSPQLAQKLNGNLSLAIFGLTLIVVMIAAPGGIQGLLHRVGRWSVALLRRSDRQ